MNTAAAPVNSTSEAHNHADQYIINELHKGKYEWAEPRGTHTGDLRCACSMQNMFENWILAKRFKGFQMDERGAVERWL